MQVSEIAKHQGDHAVSGDLLERALFNIGRSVQSSFGSCLREGKARLDFDVKENREFWLAGWRYLINLGMKGTWKTAYEWAKVLLSLDPDDPYCISLTIDQIAIKAQEHEHFIQLCTHPTFSDRWKLLPNIHSSLALAYFQRGSAKESREHLRTAISRYPWIFCRLTQELNISPVPKSIWGAQAPNEAFELFTELYISRAKDIWNTPEVISLLMEVADSIDAPKPTAEAPLITLNVARHVILSDIPAVTTHLPRSFIANRISASDPLPPNEDHETEAQRPGDASWFYGAVRDMIGLENVEELLGGFVPPFGRDRNQDPETDLDAWSDDENGGASEELESYLFTTGLQEVCEFISVNGVDPGNWQIERDETPIAAWIRRLKELHPAVWTEMIEIASSRAGLPMLSPVLRDELSRTTDTASE